MSLQKFANEWFDSSIIYNTSKMETTQMSVNGWMNKQKKYWGI